MLFKCLFFVVALFQFVEVWPVETRMRDVCNFHGTDDLTSVYIVQTGGMPALSEFRRRKLYFIFDRFFDVNRSGTIERKDFELAVEQICQIRGWAKGESKYLETSKKFLEIWDALRSSADANKDDQVSRDEWCQLWSDEDASEDWQKAYMQFMFNLQDTSGDGSIDVDEFTSVCTSFGIGGDESRRAFKIISQDGKLKVDIKYYSALWKEFFYSDDATSIGTYIFGKTSFD